MITLTSDHQTLLNTRQFQSFDLYDWTFQDGSHIRLCGNARTVIWNGTSYLGSGPILERGDLRISRGLDADEFKLNIRPREDSTLNGIGWYQACANGFFDGAQFVMYRGHAPLGSALITGAVIRFKGFVDTVDTDDTLIIEMNHKSFMMVLGRQWPPFVYQSGCCRTVYDTGCTLSRSAWQTTSSCLAGSTQTVIQTSLSQAAGFFSGGEIRFTGGNNAGARRTVRLHASGALTLAYPLNFAPTAGDTFAIWPGCDGTYATCTGKFSNGTHFSGEPVIPVPETTY